MPSWGPSLWHVGARGVRPGNSAGDQRRIGCPPSTLKAASVCLIFEDAGTSTALRARSRWRARLVRHKRQVFSILRRGHPGLRPPPERGAVSSSVMPIPGDSPKEAVGGQDFRCKWASHHLRMPLKNWFEIRRKWMPTPGSKRPTVTEKPFAGSGVCQDIHHLWGSATRRRRLKSLTLFQPAHLH